jgi:serine/threonine-protein kinase
MEFIDGVTLREVLAGGALELERAARLLTQIGEALAAAHRSGVLHRDLKPENVMISHAGSPAECVKLIDFGIASSLSHESSDHTTQLAGSPGYLAPERWVGIATCASDIYSLAAIAAEVIAGTSITDLRSSETDLRSVEERIQALCPGVPQSAIDLLAAALRYDPADRPQDADAFAHELAGHLASVDAQHR